MKDPLEDVEKILECLSPEIMASMLADIADTVNLEPPCGDMSSLFFQRALVETVKSNAKAAGNFFVVERAFKIVFNGR